jgi:5-methylcytosine-specific restriction protein A
MPTAPKRPCAQGCASLVDAGFCSACITKRAPTRETASANERGYGRRWQKASKAFLRAHPFAVDIFNRHDGRIYPAELVDHIVPHHGDMTLFWDVNNWQGLTREDHGRKSALEDGAFGNDRKPTGTDTPSSFPHRG